MFQGNDLRDMPPFTCVCALCGERFVWGKPVADWVYCPKCQRPGLVHACSCGLEIIPYTKRCPRCHEAYEIAPGVGYNASGMPVHLEEPDAQMRIYLEEQGSNWLDVLRKTKRAEFTDFSRTFTQRDAPDILPERPEDDNDYED